MKSLHNDKRCVTRRAASMCWRGTVAGAFAAFLAAGAARAEDPGFPAPNGDPSVLSAGAKLDRVFGAACALTEGVATSPDGMVYFSDITFTTLCKDASGKFAQAGNIWKYDPKSKQATIFRSPSGMSNGMKFDADGNLIVAEGADFGGRRLTDQNRHEDRQELHPQRALQRPAIQCAE